MMGDAGVGKTALVSQFMTSEYMHTYDASLGELQGILFFYYVLFINHIFYFYFCEIFDFGFLLWILLDLLDEHYKKVNGFVNICDRIYWSRKNKTYIYFKISKERIFVFNTFISCYIINIFYAYSMSLFEAAFYLISTYYFMCVFTSAKISESRKHVHFEIHL